VSSNFYLARGPEIFQTFNAQSAETEIKNFMQTYMPSVFGGIFANRDAWLGIAIALTIIFLILIILLIWMRNRIRLAVAILKEAAQAVGSMPSLFLFPIFPILWSAVFIAYWIGVAL
jgi:hypothetical protein